MSQSPSRISSKPHAERWFYTIATTLLLVFTLVGFRYFYLEGKSYPGRPLTPPIRTLLVVHGVMMTLWMLLAVAQPLLVATKHRRLHMKVGVFGVLLACAMVVVGVGVGIEATRVNPPEMVLFGLTMKQFMAVPVIGILTFGIFVLIGVWNRKQPDLHRPMMLMASLAIVSAALGRISVLNAWYAGTWLEHGFSANLVAVLIGAVLLGVKCLLSKSFDRAFALAFAILFLSSLATSLLARTRAWDRVGDWLLG